MTPFERLKNVCRIGKQSLAHWCLAGCALLGSPLVAHAGFDSSPLPNGAAINWNPSVLSPSSNFTPLGGSVASGNSGLLINNGVLNGRSTTKIPVPNGNVIDVDARVVPSGSSIGGALGNLAKKLIYPLSVGSAIYDFGKEMGFLFDKDAQGNLTVSKPDPTLCYVAPCNEYRIADGWSPNPYTNAPWSRSHSEACVVRANWMTAYPPNPLTSYGAPVFADGICNINVYYNGNLSGVAQYWQFSSRSVAPSEPVYVPSTVDEFSSAVAAKNDFSPTSKLPQAVADALASGETLQAPAPVVTGPSSVPGASSTTVVNGDTITKTDVHNVTYNNNTVTYNTVTTTTVNGVQTEQTTKTADQPADECVKHPDSLNCVNRDVPDDKVPKVTKTVSWAAENLGLGGGSCPAPYSMITSKGTYTVDLSSYCSMLSTIVKPVIILLALLAAFFIVAPVREGL